MTDPLVRNALPGVSTVTAESPAARWVIGVLSVVVFAAVIIASTPYPAVAQHPGRRERWRR